MQNDLTASNPARWLVHLAVAVIVTLTYLAFSPGLGGPFLLDDQANIQSAAVDSLDWRELRLRIFATERLAGLSRSVGKLSFALTQYASGYSPRVFKQQNLLLHLANGLLVFWVNLLLVRARAGDSVGGRWAAVAIAAIWLLHPLQVSTVLYAVQRLVLLSAFFSLSALVCYLKGRLLARRRPWAGSAVMLLGLALFWPLALFSKENAVLLAPVLLLIEWFVFRFRTEPGAERNLVWSVLGAFVLLPMVAAGGFIGLHHEALLAGYAGRDFTLSERLMTEVNALWLYLKLILVPVPTQMSLYHDGFPIQRVLDPAMIGSTAGLAALMLLGVLLGRRAPLVGLGILWFFAWHGLESTVIPLEPVFEHRNYLALMGVALALVALAWTLAGTAKLQRILAGGAVALVLLLGLNTASRAFGWSSFDLLILAGYDTHPESSRVVEGMYVRAFNKRDWTAALRFLEELRTLNPDNAYPLILKTLLYCGQPPLPAGLLDETQRLASSGRVSPATIHSLRSLAQAVRRGQCAPVAPERVLALAEGIANNTRVHQGSSRVAASVTWAVIAADNGNMDTAAAAMKMAIALAADESPATLNEALRVGAFIAEQTGNIDKARAFVAEIARDHAARLQYEGISVHLKVQAAPD